MREIARSLCAFVKGTCPALLAIPALFSDPLDWLKWVGWVDEGKSWALSVEWRQGIVVTFLLLWAFLWFHRQRMRFEASRPAKADMPIHEAARYIARNSAWAAERDPKDDSSWVTDVSQELMSALHCGYVESWGKAGPSRIMTPIPKEQFAQPKWRSEYLSMGRVPPSRITGSDGTRYTTVQLNRAQVSANWPKRSWRKAWGHWSPIDRINLNNRCYDEKFAIQDEMYRKNYGFEVDSD